MQQQLIAISIGVQIKRLFKAFNFIAFQIINPIKTKEALVDQLKTQITDLERFIEFLHGMPHFQLFCFHSLWIYTVIWAMWKFI